MINLLCPRTTFYIRIYSCRISCPQIPPMQHAMTAWSGDNSEGVQATVVCTCYGMVFQYYLNLFLIRLYTMSLHTNIYIIIIIMITPLGPWACFSSRGLATNIYMIEGSSSQGQSYSVAGPTYYIWPVGCIGYGRGRARTEGEI